MNDRKVYEVIAERHDPWWLLRVPEINSVTQVRQLDAAPSMAKDLIHAITDDEPRAFDVIVKVSLEPDIDQVVVKARMAAAGARRSQLEASIQSRNAAKALEDCGLSIRDIGNMLGVSHQRVSQLLRETGDAKRMQQSLDEEIAKGDESDMLVVGTTG